MTSDSRTNKPGAGNPTPNGKPKPVAEYLYRDESGNVLYKVVRSEPGHDGRSKDFLPYRPGRNGGWETGIKGIRRVLYRLDELVSADRDLVVFVVEGEGKADLLKELGLLSTSAPFGANAQWSPQYSEQLRGRTVVILPDNDSSGRKKVKDVARQLNGFAQSVTVLELPGLVNEGDDVKEWVAAGGTKEELLELARRAALNGKPAAPVEVPPSQRGDAWEPASGKGASSGGDGKSRRSQFAAPIPCSELHSAPEGADWLWHGYLARRTVTLLSALWKSGKTTLLAHLLKAFQSGGSFCDLKTRQTNVLYVAEENQALWAQRRDEIGLGDWCHFQIRPFSVKPRMAEWLDFLIHLQDVLFDWPADLVVFDTLASLWPVRDENNASEVVEALTPLNQLTERHAVGLLLAHHLSKGDGAEAKGSRGSGAICSVVDIILELRRYAPGERADRRRIITGYGRFEATPSELVVEFLSDGTGYRAEGNRQEIVSKELRQAITALLPCEPPGITAEAIRDQWPEEACPRKDRLLSELRDGVERGDWQREGLGVKGKPFTFWVRPPG